MLLERRAKVPFESRHFINRVNERDRKQAQPTNIVAMVTITGFPVFLFFMDFYVKFDNPDSMTSVVRDHLPSIETKYAGKG